MGEAGLETVLEGGERRRAAQVDAGSVIAAAIRGFSSVMTQKVPISRRGRDQAQEVTRRRGVDQLDAGEVDDHAARPRPA